MQEKAQQVMTPSNTKKTFAMEVLSPPPAATPKSQAKKELPVVKDDHIKIKEPKKEPKE